MTGLLDDLEDVQLERVRLSEVIAAGGIRSVYQPIVELDSGEVVAHEALARGPEGSPLESPAALFRTAARQGLTCELDRACCASAIRGAVSAGLPSVSSLFVNVEPEAVNSTLGGDQGFLGAAHGRFDVFFEVTERAVTSRPAELLEAVERMRGAGYGIALDDVGVDRGSLALLPLLRPDVVKLDMSLIHEHPSRSSGEVMNGVCAYAELTGAVILAEGIETEQHLLAAQSLGATLAQGWYFGRPEPLDPGVRTQTRSAVRLGLPARVVHTSPFDLVSSQRRLRIGRKDVLLSVTRALEAQALELGGHAVVAATFQHVRHFTPRTRDRYTRMAAQISLTAALAGEMSPSPAHGVRGAALAPDDPLVHEWDIAVLGPHYAGALIARDLGDTGPDMLRRFEFALTFDRDLVVDVTASLLARLRGVAAAGA